MQRRTCWLLLLTSGIVLNAAAQTATLAGAASPAPAKLTCPIIHSRPTEADKAFTERRYAEAETLYRAQLEKSPADADAMTGLVRSLLDEEKGAEALAAALVFDKEAPNNATAKMLMGMVQLRLGNMNDVVAYLNQAVKLNPCNAWAHYAESRYLSLAGYDARSEAQLDSAHVLAPDDSTILRRWKQSNPPKKTQAERISELKEKLARTDLPADEHDAVAATLQAMQTQEKGDCRAVTSIAGTTLPLIPMSNGPVQNVTDIYGSGLELQINGKKHRFLLDTGASGLLLNRSVAKAAGLTPELQETVGGVGDEGRAGGYVTHVDDIKIGAIEFKNCMVEVVDKRGALDVDGLIGADVFKDYLVTLDFPGRQMKMEALPLRPGETAQASTLSTAGDYAEWKEPRDRYISPAMKDWWPFYRRGHELLVPTSIGKAPIKLFLLDSGAMGSSISPAAASEVTSVGGDNGIEIRGLSGSVNQVKSAGYLMMAFAGVKQPWTDMVAFDTSSLSRNAGVEISGFIGYSTLRQVTVQLDYRDNLMHVAYDSKHGYH
jgi:tetratricopeptide (TPR) repeat protein